MAGEPLDNDGNRFDCSHSPGCHSLESSLAKAWATTGWSFHYQGKMPWA